MLKAKQLKSKRDALDEVIAKVERNETENVDFSKLSKLLKGWLEEEEDADDIVAVQVILHLLNRMRRLEKRVRELEGD